MDVTWSVGISRRLLLVAAVAIMCGCGGSGNERSASSVVIGGGSSHPVVQPVDGNRPPTAAIAASQVAGAGLAVVFNGTASTDSDGSIVRFDWAFGDGESSSSRLVSHRYARPGTYRVSLTVTDNNGASDRATITVSVGGNATANLPPGAAFTATPPTGSAPLSVVFDATLSEDTDGQIVDYLWSFGDGRIGRGVLVSHTFAVPNAYPVELTVVDNLGARGRASLTVFVASATGNVGDGFSSMAIQETSGSVGADMHAVHRFELRAGESVELGFSAERIALTDLDLYLFDVSDPRMPVLADSSIDQGDVERVTAPASGSYAVLVEAVGAGSEYRLRSGGEAARQPMTLADEVDPQALLPARSGEAPAGGAIPLGSLEATDVVDPLWAGQPLEARHRSVRQAKRLGLDPAALEQRAAIGR